MRGSDGGQAVCCVGVSPQAGFWLRSSLNDPTADLVAKQADATAPKFAPHIVIDTKSLLAEPVQVLKVSLAWYGAFIVPMSELVAHAASRQYAIFVACALNAAAANDGGKARYLVAPERYDFEGGK